MDSSFITLTECVLERLSTHKTHISLFLNKKQRLLPSKSPGFTLIGTVKAFTGGIKNMEWLAAS